MPLFAATVVHEFAALYGFDTVSSDYMDALDVSNSQNEDKRVITHVGWDTSLELSSNILSEYNIYRGSRNQMIKTGT